MVWESLNAGNRNLASFRMRFQAQEGSATNMTKPKRVIGIAVVLFIATAVAMVTGTSFAFPGISGCLLLALILPVVRRFFSATGATGVAIPPGW